MIPDSSVDPSASQEMIWAPRGIASGPVYDSGEGCVSPGRNQSYQPPADLRCRQGNGLSFKQHYLSAAGIPEASCPLTCAAKRRAYSSTAKCSPRLSRSWHSSAMRPTSDAMSCTSAAGRASLMSGTPSHRGSAACRTARSTRLVWPSAPRWHRILLVLSIPDAFLLPRTPSPDLVDIMRAERGSSRALASRRDADHDRTGHPTAPDVVARRLCRNWRADHRRRFLPARR